MGHMRAMTERERLKAALDTLRWGPAALAAAAQVRFDSAKQWLTGRRSVPPATLAWLETLAAFHRANPPPKLPPGTPPIAGEAEIRL